MRLAVQAPFHLEATVRVLQRRPVNRVDQWRENRYSRALTVADHSVLVVVENRGTIDAPDVRCNVLGDVSPSMRAMAVSAVRRILGLDQDSVRLQHAASAQSAFRPISIALRGMRPPRFASLFEAFANVVPFQQLSLDAGVAIVMRLVERFGIPFPDDNHTHFAFPTACAIAAARLDSLRRCGLSARKAQTLKELARVTSSGELVESSLESMSTRDALRTLTELPGIGTWSASLVLLRGMGRLDVFPPGDVGAMRELRALMNLDSLASIDDVIDRLGSQRGYLYFHLIGGSLLRKGLIHAAPEARNPRSRLGSPEVSR